MLHNSLIINLKTTLHIRHYWTVILNSDMSAELVVPVSVQSSSELSVVASGRSLFSEVAITPVNSQTRGL